MDKYLYVVARALVALVQALPLAWAAQLGRCGGGVAFWLDARHRRVALRNLTLCFSGGKSPREIRALAHENFRRIGENFCCAIKVAAMKEPEVREVVEIRGAETVNGTGVERQAEGRIFATGHFGNFELFTRFAMFVQGYQCALTYRGLRHPLVDGLVHSLRTVSGNLLFERRTDTPALKKAMEQGGLLLVLLSDQSARDNG